jgi:hypothetical protein
MTGTFHLLRSTVENVRTEIKVPELLCSTHCAEQLITERHPRMSATIILIGDVIRFESSTPTISTDASNRITGFVRRF